MTGMSELRPILCVFWKSRWRCYPIEYPRSISAWMEPGIRWMSLSIVFIPPCVPFPCRSLAGLALSSRLHSMNRRGTALLGQLKRSGTEIVYVPSNVAKMPRKVRVRYVAYRHKVLGFGIDGDEVRYGLMGTGSAYRLRMLATNYPSPDEGAKEDDVVEFCARLACNIWLRHPTVGVVAVSMPTVRSGPTFPEGYCLPTGVGSWRVA